MEQCRLRGDTEEDRVRLLPGRATLDALFSFLFFFFFLNTASNKGKEHPGEGGMLQEN
jgi:hypothetical protein